MVTVNEEEWWRRRRRWWLRRRRSGGYPSAIHSVLLQNKMLPFVNTKLVILASVGDS